MDRLDRDLVLSIVTRVEMEGSLGRRSPEDDLRRRRLDEFLKEVPILAFGDSEAAAYREIVQQLGYSRRKLLDRMIAAQALVHGATLVTRNPDDFRDVPGLDLLAW